MRARILKLITSISQPFVITLIWILQRVMPADSSLVLFGAMNGLWYGDNSQHLYEWVLDHPETNLNPLWITRNRRVYKQLLKANKPVAFAYSYKAFVALARARVGVFTDSLHDVSMNPWIIPKTLQLIALRHGRSVKRVRFARLGHKITEREARIRKREGELIKAAISTSEFISDLQEECLQLGRSKHVVTGYPRNDALLDVPRESIDLWNNFIDSRKPDKVVLYAPSWRHGRGYTRFFPFEDLDISDLAQYCEDNKCLLLLRPHRLDLHYAELRAFFSKLTKSPWIQLATHKELPDVNTFLPFIDCLISDYSALFHDYLLLDRPMMFVPYDYDDFKQQNGFLYDYYQNLPGPELKSYADFKSELIDVMAEKDSHREKRHLLNNKIHEFQDTQSCKRVADLLSQILLEHKN